MTQASAADVGAPGMLISISLALGDYERARRFAKVTLERAEAALIKDRNNGFVMSFGVPALAVLGQSERAKQWINRALLIDPNNMLMRFNFACALSIHFGDADGAVDLLEEVVANGPKRLVEIIGKDPDLDPIRDHPRYKALLPAIETRLASR